MKRKILIKTSTIKLYIITNKGFLNNHKKCTEVF